MRVGVRVRARSGDRVTARARARARVGVGARVRARVSVRAMVTEPERTSPDAVAPRHMTALRWPARHTG